METFFGRFLIAFCMAILEKYLAKGTSAFIKHQELKAELGLNEKKANDYQKVVNDPNATREDRENAEDIIGR